MRDRFAHLHTHSHSSGFDGFGTEADFAKRVKELGQTSLAMTEHGTLRGLISAQEACDAAEIKFIPGIEAYLSDDMDARGISKEDRARIASLYDDPIEAKIATKAAESARRDRDHITLWAMDDIGLKNLYRLSSESWNRGFYYKPRLDLNLLEKCSEGVIASTGCPGGVVTSPIRRGDFAEALRRFDRLKTAFGDRLYVEVMPHKMHDCEDLADILIELGGEATLIATQDAHYPSKDDAPAQECMVCLHAGECVSDTARFSARAFGETEFYIKTRSEMIDAYAKIGVSRTLAAKMCDATEEFSDRCTSRVHRAKTGEFLVSPPLGDHETYSDWLIDICVNGYMMRYGVDLNDAFENPMGEAEQKRVERFIHEYEVISKAGFEPYLIMVWDVIRFCRDSKIRVGPGRGSAAGSLVCYLMGITNIDPVKYGLSFERFLVEGRKDLPDVDVDIQGDRRHEVIEYLSEKYGHDRVSLISTSITMRGKGAIRDVARVYEVPSSETERLTSIITDAISEEDRGDTIADALKNTEIGKAFAKKFPDVSEIAMKMEGNLKTVGIHPAGIVVSPAPIMTVVPLESRANPSGDGRVAVTAFGMEDIEKQGLVKLDILGLDAMTMQSIACLEASIDDIDSISLNDVRTLDAFTAGRFGGIFQYDSPGSRKLCRGFEFKKFLDIATMTALNRPGPLLSGLAQQFIVRSEDPSKVEPVHPIYDEIMSSTYGVIVYQEQLIELAHKLAGYTAAEADGFRKRVAKKKGVTEDHAKFVDGCISAGMMRNTAESLFDKLVGFGSYAFSLNHAAAYGMIGYQMMYLKVYHPGAFYAAALSIKEKDQDQLRMAGEARVSGIPVSPPDVNHSKSYFAYITRPKVEIVGAIKSIKGIGESTADAIQACGPYMSLLDFYVKTADTGVNKGTFSALAACNALRTISSHRKILVENSDIIWESLKKGFDVVLDVPEIVEDYSQREAVMIAAARYKLFIDEDGMTEAYVATEMIRSKISRHVVVPGEAPEEGPDWCIVAGRLNTTKTFGGRGEKSARISIISDAGIEIAGRVDADALEQCSVAIEKAGKMIVAIVYVRSGDNGVSYSVDMAWTIDAIMNGEGEVLDWLRRAPRTKPRDPSTALSRIDVGRTTTISGMVIKVRNHVDKNGGAMKTFSILGEKGYTRVLCFASRTASKDSSLIKHGNVITVSVKKISEDALTVADSEIKLNN